MKMTSLNVLMKMKATYFVFLLYRKENGKIETFQCCHIRELLKSVDSIPAKNPGINFLSAVCPQLRNATISDLGTSKIRHPDPVLRLYPQLTASLDDKSCTRGSSNLDVVWEEKSQMALSPF
jgi:hypothetical protein